MKCTDWFIDADTHVTEPRDVWTSRRITTVKPPPNGFRYTGQ